MNYVAPSIETIRKYGLESHVRRALGLIHAVRELGENRWSVNGHVVVWDGVGWLCDCTDYALKGPSHGYYCKHPLAVCLRSEAYRWRVIEAIEGGMNDR